MVRLVMINNFTCFMVKKKKDRCISIQMRNDTRYLGYNE
jgi:hypothetical protein